MKGHIVFSRKKKKKKIFCLLQAEFAHSMVSIFNPGSAEPQYALPFQTV